MATIIGRFFMLFSSISSRAEFKQVLASMASRIAIVVCNLSHSSNHSTGKSGTGVRRRRSVLEHSDANHNDLWNPLGPKPLNSDFEFVENLLQFCQVDDSKIKAETALKELGSIPKLFDASVWRLKRLGLDSPVLHQHISLVKNSLDHYLKPNSFDPTKIKTYRQIFDYLKFHHGHLNVEHLRVLFLDSMNRLINDQMLREGTNDACPIYVREILFKAIDVRAAAIILVHNHPSSTVNASRQDIQATKDICDACRKVGIAVHDHIIISGAEHFSFRAQGLM